MAAASDVSGDTDLLDFPAADDDFQLLSPSMPQLERTSGRGGGKGRPRLTRLPGGCKAAYENCNVCMDTDMAKGMKQCKKHNKVVRAIDDTLRSGDLINNTNKRKQFQDLRDNAPDYPPSQFSTTVLEFEEKFQRRVAARDAEILQKPRLRSLKSMS